MNVSYKRALWTSCLFGFLFFFLILYFTILGPLPFLENKIHFLINSIVLFITMSSFAIMLLLTNKSDNVVDERDNSIQKKATSTGLLLTSMYVFLLAIILFVVYRNDVYIYVSWLWFIAYTTFAFAYFITSVLIIYFYNSKK